MRMHSLLALAAPLFLATGIEAADEPGLSVARWGNTLIVTAPGGGTGDARIAGALSPKLTIDFREATIDEIAEFLRKATGVNIVVAPAVTAQATSVTLTARDMTLGNALNWVKTLTHTHVGYVHEALYISDKPIQEESVTRMYDVSDLVMVMRDFPGPELALNAPTGKGGGALLMPPVENTQPAPTTDEVVDLIKKVVHPGEWRE